MRGTLLGIMLAPAMRVAFLANQESANGLYRAVLPMTGLASQGHAVRAIVPSKTRALLDQLENVDVLHIHRYCDPTVQRLMRHARERGVAVVWDDDDDAGANRGTAHYRHAGTLAWERRRAAVNRVLAIADLVTTPSRELAERFAERGARRTAVVENYIPGLFLQARAESRPGVTIGWVAGSEHAHDAEQLSIASVLERVLEQRPDVRVVTVGLRLDIDSERYEHVRDARLLQLEQGTRALGRRADNVYMQKMQPGLASLIGTFDIAIAALADAPFNRARSNIKLKEYAAGEAAWLASPVGPYAGMGEAQGGRLVPDDRWFEAIMRLADKPRERRKLAKAGRKWVTGETIERNAHRWDTLLSEAVVLGRDRHQSIKTPML